jgi:hypothetical protein
VKVDKFIDNQYKELKFSSTYLSYKDAEAKLLKQEDYLRKNVLIKIY